MSTVILSTSRNQILSSDREISPSTFLAVSLELHEMDYELENAATVAVESRFYAWATSRGAKISPKVGLKDFGSMGRGAVALEDIEVGPAVFYDTSSAANSWIRHSLTKYCSRYLVRFSSLRRPPPFPRYYQLNPGLLSLAGRPSF